MTPPEGTTEMDTNQILLTAPPSLQFNQLVQVGHSDQALQAILAKIQGEVPQNPQTPDANFGLALENTFNRLQMLEQNIGGRRMKEDAVFLEIKMTLEDMKNDVLMIQGVVQRWGGIDATLAHQESVDYLHAQVEHILGKIHLMEENAAKSEKLLGAYEATQTKLERIELTHDYDEILPLLSKMENRMVALEENANNNEGKFNNHDQQLGQVQSTLKDLGNYLLSLRNLIDSQKNSQTAPTPNAQDPISPMDATTPPTPPPPSMVSDEVWQKINVRFHTIENFALHLQKENATLKSALLFVQREHASRMATMERDLQMLKQGGVASSINAQLIDRAILEPLQLGHERVSQPEPLQRTPPKVQINPPSSLGVNGPNPGIIVIRPPSNSNANATGAALPNIIAQGLLADALSDLTPMVEEGPPQACNVQAIDSNPPQGGSLALLMGARAIGGDWPKLENKLQGGWEEFERKWVAKMGLMKGWCGGLPQDELLFEAVKACLDPADQIFLQNFRESGPTKSFG